MSALKSTLIIAAIGLTGCTGTHHMQHTAAIEGINGEVWPVYEQTSHRQNYNYNPQYHNYTYAVPVRNQAWNYNKSYSRNYYSNNIWSNRSFQTHVSKAVNNTDKFGTYRWQQGKYTYIFSAEDNIVGTRRGIVCRAGSFDAYAPNTHKRITRQLCMNPVTRQWLPVEYI